MEKSKMGIIYMKIIAPLLLIYLIIEIFKSGYAAGAWFYAIMHK